MIKRNRTLITFTACLDSEGLGAGSYAGQIGISGPRKLQPASVAVVANLRDGKLFRRGLILALVAALVLMIYGHVKKIRGQKTWWRAFWDNTRPDDGFWVESAIGLVAAGLAAGAVYAQDPAWGDDAFPSLVALGGTTLAAAGVQNLIATARGK